jgi:hypothetical protein
MNDGCRALGNIFGCWGINLARALDTNAFVDVRQFLSNEGSWLENTGRSWEDKHMACDKEAGGLAGRWKPLVDEGAV